MRTWITPVYEDLNIITVVRARLVPNIHRWSILMDDPSSFTTSGGMYTIESLHDNLNLDALMFSNSYPSAPLLEVPVVHCAAQTAARGAFKTPHPVPRGYRYYHTRLDKFWGPFRVVNLEHCLLTPGSAFETGCRSPTIESPSSFPGPAPYSECPLLFVDCRSPLPSCSNMINTVCISPCRKPNVRSSIPFLREHRGLPVSHRVDW